jgi:3-phenylpropionate/cinnamic acid dioxygenase small subunit
VVALAARGVRVIAAELLYREALYLDEQRWDEWLALYTDDALLWMPAWTGTHELTTSPDTQLSLIYCEGRARLEDRVWRIRSHMSVASDPLPRTVHNVTNVLVLDERDGALDVRASWTVHLYDTVRVRQDVFFGRYRYELRTAEGALRIARKTIVLANDRIPTMLDFYCV